QRTLQKVMELPQVQEARAELARQAQRKGPEPGM
ncbi:mobilization A domain protein, partial [Escherichia coli]|nr:mobilization A domain protein [Escherichia coli]